MRRRLFSKRAAWGLLAAFVLYGLLAYFIAPEFWWFKDRRDVILPSEMVTTTTDRIPGDPINVGFIGSKAELIHAFTVAGWHPADAITWRSSLEIGESVIFDRPYADAPVSTLLFEGRKQDMAFEKPVGDSAEKLLTKLSGFLISCAIPAVSWPSEASFSVWIRRSCAVRRSSRDCDSSRVRSCTSLKRRAFSIAIAA